MRLFLFGICMLSMGNLAWAQTAPSLGSARSFAVLAHETVTNTGPTIITGDLGVSPGTAVTGFSPPGTVTKGTIHSNDAAALEAQADATAAYGVLAGETCGTNLGNLILGTNPGAIVLTPGVYCYSASASLTGTLTLSGNGIYVFKIGSALTTSVASSVALTNGAKAENVFWQVGSSTTLGVDAFIVGSIFALASNTLNTGSRVDGHVFAINGAITLDTNVVTAPSSAIGRWEIVHTSGDSTAQAVLYPSSFSTFLSAGGTGYTYGTFTNSICVIDAEAFNVVPTWTSSDGINFVITITVDNLGLGDGDFSFIYTGTYDPVFPVPNSSRTIPAISGTYASTGNVSACSASTGTFTATYLPTISSDSASGTLDNFSADNGRPFTTAVGATINFGAPPADGQIAGTVALASNPIFATRACFDAPSGVVTPLTINSNRSSQSGTSIYIFAEGTDPQSIPTTLFLNGASVNLYTTTANTDANATQISTNVWAASAAIGEDNPDVLPGGVSNDGTNNAMAFSYGVIGGACDTAGGVDAPFYFLSGKPIVHKHKKPSHRDHRHRPNHERGRTRDDNDNRHWR